jgi:AcrR family transcriptional regulator
MRKRKPGRLRDIAAAALAVFIRQGFRLTQMSDVAREAGISVRALYSYVDSKDASFELAFAHALGDLPEQDVPFRASGRASAGSTFGAKLTKSIRWPVLKKTLEERQLTADSLANVVDELFTAVSQHRYLIWLLDRCSAEAAELGNIYQTTVRAHYFADFTSLIEIVTTGRELASEETAARARSAL